MEKKAVITGDIIESGRLSIEEKKRLYKHITTMLKEIGKNFKVKSEMFRGDSFQCLVQEPEDALRIALLIKTGIRMMNPKEKYSITSDNDPGNTKKVIYTKWMVDARVAIGVGEVELEMKKVATSDGEAFWLSGSLLDSMKNTRRSLGISSDDEYNEELETESILLDALILKTTALQSEVIFYKLSELTEIEIARQLDIQQSAVNQRSNSGNWNAISAMVDRFEYIYRKEIP